MPEDIQSHREAIDRIDAEVTRLIGERAAHAQAIGHLKGAGPVYRPEREAQVFANVEAANRANRASRTSGALGASPLPDGALRPVFNEIMSACRGLEQRLVVAYLGPAGTFSEMAVSLQFGHAVEAQPCPSIDAVFRATESEGANYAVVPVENSTEGAIGRTLDLLMQTPLMICGEVVVRVHQNLMSRGVPIAAITKVFSHAQSLAQCHGWLSHHAPKAERVAVSSNAEAARLAAEASAQAAGIAAIGPAIAAERYGLGILAPNIEDDARNRTRFLVLGKQDTAPSGNDRTSLVLSAHNRPGAVHALLTPIAANGVSMTRIESRPARTGGWEYLFYVDLEGHAQEPRVAKALAELRAQAPFVKVLGSYPCAPIL